MSFTPYGTDMFGEQIKRGIGVRQSNLQDKHDLNPFTVLEVKNAEWQQRKKAWIAWGLKGEIGREDTKLFTVPPNKYRGGANYIPEYSVFDPVLTEIMIKWFSPEYGWVLDPFAGGSVRGVMSRLFNRRYWGCDLNERQIQANEEQGDELLWPLHVEEIEGFKVVRDDKLPGGTKERMLRHWVQLKAERGVTHFVGASSPHNSGMYALARVCRSMGFKCTIFVPQRKDYGFNTAAVRAYGAEVYAVKAGYASVVRKRASDYAQAYGAYLCPFGFRDDDQDRALALMMRGVEAPKEAWVAVGGGGIINGMRAAWPDTDIHGVYVGNKPPEDVAQWAALHSTPYKYGEYPKPAVSPSIPAHANYDAKVWAPLKAEGTPGALWWNVAASNPETNWVGGDSEVMLDYAPQADFILTCPPYGDLEKYTDDPADLSNLSFNDFMAKYERILLKAVKRLRPNSFACIVVGNWRGSDGCLIDFNGLTSGIMYKAGLKLYNDGILATMLVTAMLRASANFGKNHKLTRVHQYVNVYVKGDPKAAMAKIHNSPYKPWSRAEMPDDTDWLKIVPPCPVLNEPLV